ncbi:stage II sporulation protein M [Candidatus Woesearchaeota archaeon]|nr:stage II sporulation protein M [Candidatus Woesearchaeota archaeon]
MFDKIFDPRKVQSNANYALFAGVFFTLVSFAASYILFQRTTFVGVASVIFTIALAMPLVIKFFERAEKKDESFFPRTKHMFDFYIYFFIGAFVVFFLVSLAMPSKVLTSEQLYGSATRIILPQNGIPAPPIEEFSLFMKIWANNNYVMVVAFVLSLLYGAGSLLLMVLNASIFASSLSDVIRQSMAGGDFFSMFSFMSCNMGIMLFHMIPEVAAYLLAAIAGGKLSSAVVDEKLFSPGFFKTLKNSVLIFIASLFLLAIGALIETNISRNLFQSGACLGNTWSILGITTALVFAVIVFEIRRNKR